MILLHLYSSNSEILLQPRYMTFVEQEKDHTYIYYAPKGCHQELKVKETLKEIQELIYKSYIPF